MKKVWKGNKATLIVLIVVIVVLSALAVGGIAYAIWTRVSDDSEEFNLPIDPYNPSEKYIVFQGLDSDGNLLESDENAVAYAVVGYTGLVAEVVIPASHNDKPVVKICTDNGTNLNSRLSGNDIITSLQIPATVTEISSRACSEMSLLQKVEILGEGTLIMGDFAFAFCPALETFDYSREIISSSDNYLLGDILLNE